MTNAELIKAIRYCVVHPYRPCDGCVLFETDGCINVLHGAAADAIEAADKRIEQLEKQEPTEKQVVDYCHKRCLVIVEEELFHRMKSTFSQLPKEGEWIVDKNGDPQIICSICDVHIPMVAGWCMDAHIKYCPNCGARMRGEHDEQTDC